MKVVQRAEYHLATAPQRRQLAIIEVGGQQFSSDVPKDETHRDIINSGLGQVTEDTLEKIATIVKTRLHNLAESMNDDEDEEVIKAESEAVEKVIKQFPI